MLKRWSKYSPSSKQVDANANANAKSRRALFSSGMLATVVDSALLSYRLAAMLMRQ